MPNFLETLATYSANPQALVKDKIAGNIHRGQVPMQSDNGVLGLAAKAYFDPSFYAYLGAPYFLIDGSGDTWGFISRPELRNRFPRTAHVKCFLELWASTGTILSSAETTDSAGAASYSYAPNGTFPCAIAPTNGNTVLLPQALMNVSQFKASIPTDLAITPHDRIQIDGITYSILNDPGNYSVAPIGRVLNLDIVK